MCMGRLAFRRGSGLCLWNSQGRSDDSAQHGGPTRLCRDEEFVGTSLYAVILRWAYVQRRCRSVLQDLDTLLADGMPKIYFNFKQHQISPSSYLPEWLIPLFLDHLPFEACARIWDILLLEGDSFLYRAAIGILAVLEPRLFFPDRRELLELLKGENKAAIDAAKREGRPLDGPKYEIYGVDEETLWERLDSMDEWWRESTWTRLIQRELPDL